MVIFSFPFPEKSRYSDYGIYYSFILLCSIIIGKEIALKLKYILPVLFFIIPVSMSFGETRILDCNILVKQMKKMGEDIPVESYDSNGDGKIDFMEKVDKDGNKIMEMIDFNHDGYMDDFYYYTKGIITLREIDSNYDKNIDILVYIKDGRYITKYERDLDFNGTIDQIKNFGEKNK